MVGWETKKLGDVCDFINRGVSPTYVGSGGVVVLNQRCVRDHEVSLDAARRHDSNAKRVSSERLIRAADVLVNSTGTGTLGRVAQLREDPPEPTTVDSHVTIVRPLPGMFVPEFFGYMLRDIEDALKVSGEGCGGQTELARSTLANGFYVRFPRSLPEQARLVGVFDAAFEGIAAAQAKTEQNLRSACAVFESQLESILAGDVGWIERPLSALCDIRHGFPFEGEFFTLEGDHVLLTPGNFHEAGGYRDRGPKQKFYVGPIPEDYVLREGDMLVAMTEQAAGLLGSPLLVPASGRFLHNQRLGLVSGKQSVPWVNQFFFHVFNTERVRREIHASASGVKVRHTSPTKIGEIAVKFPPTEDEQRAVAAALVALRDATERLAATYTRKLAVLDALKKSLLHQAFTGNL